MASDDGEECVSCTSGLQPNSNHSACVSCASGHAGLAGTCERCSVGTSPDVAAWTCTQCEVGTVSTDGVVCEDCDSGLSPNDVQSACQPCPNGQFYDNRIRECRACNPGSQLRTDGGDMNEPCVACGAGFNKPGLDGRCEFCGIGREATTNRQSCTECDSTTISTDAIACVACPPGLQPNRARSACESCIGNKYFDDILGECAQCSPGKMLDFEADGSEPCSPCPSGTAGGNGTCAECSSGRSPDASSVICQACEPNEVSFSGIRCVACAPGTQPNEAVEDCPDCPPGQSICDSCDAGKYSTDGSSCEPCFVYSNSEREAAMCTCDDGFSFDLDVTGDYEVVTPCVDIDECATTNGTFDGDLCDPVAIGDSCVNWPGGYNCTACPPGYDGTGYPPGCTMPEIDESLGQASSAAETTLAVTASADVLEEGSPAQEAFMSTVRQDLADSLGIPIEDIVITGVNAGGDRRRLTGRQLQDEAVSVEFDFVIDSPDFSSADVNRRQMFYI